MRGLHTILVNLFVLVWSCVLIVTLCLVVNVLSGRG